MYSWKQTLTVRLQNLSSLQLTMTTLLGLIQGFDPQIP
jgi:hypothetical protein